MFFRPQKRRNKLKKKDPTLGAHSALWAQKIAKGPIPIQKEGPKWPIPSFGGGSKDQTVADHRVRDLAAYLPSLVYINSDIVSSFLPTYAV